MTILAESRVAGSWSAQLWQQIAPTYDAILAHPFLTELADGTLNPDAFAHYVVQDLHYLRDYARALAVLAARADSRADLTMLARHAVNAAADELALHTTLLPALGLESETVATVPAAPTTLAYTSYLLATVYGGSFAEGLAAVLPCYWIYAQVGTELLQAGSPDPRYQRWIDAYGGAEFAAVVEEVLDVVDRTGLALGPQERAAAARQMATTARYEWMFWDAAYRLERWPV
jgi:thiaminase/transcriptional activator TenA